MSEPLNFYLVTDLHHYSKDLGTEGEAYRRLNNREQKCLAETGAVIDSAFDMIIADNSVDIVLVAGDISYDGALESHRDVIPKLQRLKDAGKRVYLITATHDYYVEGNGTGAAYKCDGDKMIPAERTNREQLVELYHTFGMDDATAVHRESHSYCVQLQEGYRLLCLNDDGDRVFCGYSPDQMQWILDQIKEAHETGNYIFVMTHHPVLPPMALYPFISKRDMLGDWDKTTTVLADAGIDVVFTGHTHMQNIAVKTTEKGNSIYDVNTASLVGYPSVFRKVRIDDSSIDVKTVCVEDFEGKPEGVSVNDFMKHHFSFLLNDIFDSAANDIDRLAELSTVFSMTPEQVYKLKTPVKFIGGKLQVWTLGRVGRFLRVSKYVDDSVKDILLKELLLEIVQNVYVGNEPYTPDTPEYRAMAAIMGKVKRLLSHFKKMQGVIPVLDAFLETMYNTPPEDWNYTIERKQLT